MSFTGEIKGELCKLEEKSFCCLRAACYGMWLFSRSLALRETAYVTEYPAVARKMAELAASAAGVTADISYVLSRRKKQAYKVTLPDSYSRQMLLSAFDHSGTEASLRINSEIISEDCCLAAFLRGAFLVCGLSTDPNKEYHLEFSVPYKNLADDLYSLLEKINAFKLTPSVAFRQGAYIVYIKESAQIEDLLTYLGAAYSAMELMQVKMYKEAMNNINRKTNFETANMDKTYSASARQIAAIAVISDTVGISALPEELSSLAVLRLENPGMTLRELSEALRISKSGVNHRLQRLVEIGERIGKEKGMLSGGASDAEDSI